MWQDDVYLIKMQHDTNFLHDLPQIEDEFDVVLKGNPFFSLMLPDGTSAERFLPLVEKVMAKQVIKLVDPLLNTVDARTNLRIHRASLALMKEDKRVTKSMKATGGVMIGNPNYPPPRQGRQGRSGIMQFFDGQDGDDDDDAFLIAKMLGGVGDLKAATIKSKPAEANLGKEAKTCLRFTPQQMPRSPTISPQPPDHSSRINCPAPSPTLSVIQSLCNDALAASPPSNNIICQPSLSNMTPSPSPTLSPSPPRRPDSLPQLTPIYTPKYSFTSRLSTTEPPPDLPPYNRIDGETQVFTMSTIHVLLDETRNYIDKLGEAHLDR